jgi:hypothetical protein
VATPTSYSPGQLVAADPTAIERVVAPTSEIAAQVLPYMLDCSVEEFILRRLKSAEADGEHEERARVQVIMDNVLFYRGQHWLYATQDCRVESSYDEGDEDDLVVHNWIGLIVEGKAKEWEASHPRIEVTGRTTDYRLEGAARLAQALDDYIREDGVKAHFRQSEAKFGLLCKVYFRYAMLVKDPTDETATRIRVPITEPHQFQIGAVYKCGGCENEWSEPDDIDALTTALSGKSEEQNANQIPEIAANGAEQPDNEQSAAPGCGCGATLDQQQVISPAYSFDMDVPVGVREEVIPSLKHVSVNPLSVKIDHRARRFQDSDYALIDTLERRYEVEAEFEGLDLSDVGTAANLPARLRAMQELERTTAGVEAFAFGEKLQGECREDDLIRKRRFWMLPKMYAHYRARMDEVVCGVEFKAGQRLGDVLKPGALAIVLGDNKLAKLDPESKNKVLTGSAFTLDPTTFHGKGIEDLKSIQMSIDDKATLATSHFDRAGAPSEIIDTRYVDMDEFDGSSGKRIPIKDTAPKESNTTNVHKVVEAGQLGVDFQNFFAQEPVIMREIASVGRELVGLNDPNNKTARGRETAAAASSSMLIPSLALRAEEVETETTFQNLEYWQTYAADEDFELFESQFGSEAIQTFKQLNLRRDLKVKAVPGSWVPQTKDQELQNIEDFSAKYLMPAAGGAMPMSFVRHAAGLYNIPSSVFEPEQDAKLAQSRLARLRAFADKAWKAGATQLSPQAYEMMLDSIVNQPEFIPSPIMENHPVHMEFYADQWKSMYDDKNVNPVLLDLIDKMHDSHITSMAAAELKANALKMKAQAPAIAAQTAMTEAQTDEAHASQQDDKELQSAHDSKIKDEDAQRQLALQAASQQIAPAGQPASLA